MQNQTTQFGQQLEQLTQEQREHNDRFSEQFTEQLEQLAQSQRQTCEQLAEKQQSVEEGTQTLEAGTSDPF